MRHQVLSNHLPSSGSFCLIILALPFALLPGIASSTQTGTSAPSSPAANLGGKVWGEGKVGDGATAFFTLPKSSEET
jgi:hypothetical protein